MLINIGNSCWMLKDLRLHTHNIHHANFPRELNSQKYSFIPLDRIVKLRNLLVDISLSCVHVSFIFIAFSIWIIHSPHALIDVRTMTAICLRRLGLTFLINIIYGYLFGFSLFVAFVSAVLYCSIGELCRALTFALWNLWSFFSFATLWHLGYETFACIWKCIYNLSANKDIFCAVEIHSFSLTFNNIVHTR